MTKPKEVQTLKKKDVPITPSGRFKCPLCPKSYKTFSGVRRHHIHQHATENPEPIGRPSKYDPKYIDQMYKYFGGELTQKVDTESVEYIGKGKKNKKIITRTEILPRDLPTFEMFAHKIGVHYRTLHEWSQPDNKEKYPGFLKAFEDCKSLQKDFLIQNGLHGRYNPNFSKFVGINVTDMVDRKVTEHTGKGGKAIDLNVSNETVSQVMDAFTKVLEQKYGPKEPTIKKQSNPSTE